MSIKTKPRKEAPMDDSDSRNEALFDVRTQRRRLAQGEFSQQELNAWISNLPDSAPLLENSNIRMVATHSAAHATDDLEEER
jgi:hypothetical protein